MNDPVPERIAVTFDMTVDDYASPSLQPGSDYRPEPRTAELDHTGVIISSKGVRGFYEWPVTPRCRSTLTAMLV
jgi:hypothetical protein